MPRISPRRVCFLVLVVVSCLLIFIIHQTTFLLTNINLIPTDKAFAALSVTTVDEERKENAEEEEITTPLPKIEKAWFFEGGNKWPEESKTTAERKIYPEEWPESDRITAQLMYVPPNYNPNRKKKKILVYNGLSSWAPHKVGSEAFDNCPVSNCELITNKAASLRADAILYKDHFIHPDHHKPAKQVWILYLLECPYHTQHIKVNDIFNWTATYRWDSVIVAPYEKWVYYNESFKRNTQHRNFAANKTKQVAWFVSNCGARNDRLNYAHQLQQFVNVDIFGACGTKKCPRDAKNKCFKMLDKDYKFYLAFENSNCIDYITEKFFVNGLGRDILPIVMGARPQDYKRAAPEGSYIHVDDFASPKELAQYLHELDNNDELYNTYFDWKGTGEFINTHFFCRLCAMLHDDFPKKSYRNINEWWRSSGICTSGSWRKPIISNKWIRSKN